MVSKLARGITYVESFIRQMLTDFFQYLISFVRSRSQNRNWFSLTVITYILVFIQTELQLKSNEKQNSYKQTKLHIVP